jgi:probable metal-binding protein
MKRIHGHEVMKMMLATGKPYTTAALVADIEAKFGGDARFYTCSADTLTAAELVAFLERKGKFQSCEGGFQTSPEKICNH